MCLANSAPLSKMRERQKAAAGSALTVQTFDPDFDAGDAFVKVVGCFCLSTTIQLELTLLRSSAART